MHGLLDKDGKWIEGLNENSTNWTHQWKGRGSQPGTGLKETSQFMIAKVWMMVLAGAFRII